MSLKDLDNHFDFGINWKNYSENINEQSIKIAKTSLETYFKSNQIKDKNFIDIGCGSGLFSIAALRLGFKKVISVDIDPICVSVTENNINKYWKENNWNCYVKSVFELNKHDIGDFDVVYSWGVLHHTGAMYDAIDNAIKLIKPDGQMLVGLYQKTTLCPFWVIEKKLYSSAPALIQKFIMKIFLGLYAAITYLKGKKQNKVISNYSRNRGMDYYIDLHDWLGGFPYESISPNNFKKYIKKFGFVVKQENLRPDGLGLTGSGVNEYLIYKPN